MARRFLAYTEDSALRVTLPMAVTFSQVYILVRELLGTEAATMLAEPQPVPGEGRRQWLTDAPAAAPALLAEQASPQDAASARARLVAVRDQARQIYERLTRSPAEATRQQGVIVLRAFELPSDRDHLWVVGGRPVLVGWGHANAQATPLDPPTLALTFRRPLDPPPMASSQAFSDSIAVGPPLPPVRRSAWLAPILWIVFTALALAIGWKLLRACALTIPGTSIHLSVFGACHSDTAADLSELLARNSALRDTLNSMRLALVTLPFCPSPSPQPSPLPSIALPTPPGHPGVLEVVLSWGSTDDLDLHVACGDKEIWAGEPRTRGCGGGQVDVDANAFNPNQRTDLTITPIEHAYWTKAPEQPLGVSVGLFYKRTRPNPVRFELLVHLGDRSDPQRTSMRCTGSVSDQDCTPKGLCKDHRCSKECLGVRIVTMDVRKPMEEWEKFASCTITNPTLPGEPADSSPPQ